MAITALKDSARGILAVSLVPASVAGGVWAALWAIDSGLAPEMVVFPISLASLLLVAVMERVLPYRRDWNRSHHSPDRREADTNFGNVYIFWDAVFGTRYLPGDRKPPRRVGIDGLDAFPRGFFAQWLSPFRWEQIKRDSSA